MNAKILCPVCRRTLSFDQKSASCPLGHSFDIAKEGYVNLLVRQGKAPAIQGDTLEMLKARRSFLQKGCYDGLIEVIAGVIAKYQLKFPQDKYDILDAGCGEGYYLGRIIEQIGHDNAIYYGTDVSKSAIAMAAKEHEQANFFVADTNTFLPFADSSIDILLNIFAPRNADEFERVLASGGILIVVIPGPDHLKELRERFDMLSIEPDKSAKVQEKLAGFHLVESRSVNSSVKLAAESILEVLKMTPNAWFLSEMSVGPMVITEDVRVTIEFELLVFKNRAATQVPNINF